MKSNKILRFNGETFTSLKNLCNKYKVDYERFIYYHKKGIYTISTCLKKARGKNVVYKGIEYRNLKELCDKLNVSYSTVTKRLKYGLSVDQAIDNPKGSGKNAIDFNGKLYGSYKDIYDELKPNLTYSGFVKRLKKVLNTFTVASPNRISKLGTVVNYNNVKYRNLMEFYKSLDTKLSYSYLVYLYKSGVSIDKIVDTMSNGAHHLKCNGIEYKSTLDFINKNNLKAYKVYRCLKKGYSAEKCLRVCKYSSHAFEYDGKVYNSLAEFCRVHNLKYSKVKYKVYDKGLSIYEALDELE